MGIALSAACGFRVFVPLAVVSVASLTGYVTLSPGFEWIGTIPSLVAFGTATVLEVLAYYIPWVDHLLDTIATPAAVLAGIVVSASTFVELSPMVRWILAIVAGGGAAGIVQGATVVARLKSTALSAGLTNPILSTAELAGSLVTSLLAIAVPMLCLMLILLGVYLISRSAGRFVFGRHP
jgi:hypothetical protein